MKLRQRRQDPFQQVINRRFEEIVQAEELEQEMAPVATSYDSPLAETRRSRVHVRGFLKVALFPVLLVPGVIMMLGRVLRKAAVKAWRPFKGVMIVTLLLAVAYALINAPVLIEQITNNDPDQSVQPVQAETGAEPTVPAVTLPETGETTAEAAASEPVAGNASTVVTPSPSRVTGTRTATSTQTRPATRPVAAPAPAPVAEPAPAEEAAPAPATATQPAPAQQADPAPAEQTAPAPSSSGQPAPAEQAAPAPSSSNETGGGSTGGGEAVSQPPPPPPPTTDQEPSGDTGSPSADEGSSGSSGTIAEQPDAEQGGGQCPAGTSPNGAGGCTSNSEGTNSGSF